MRGRFGRIMLFGVLGAVVAWAGSTSVRLSSSRVTFQGCVQCAGREGELATFRTAMVDVDCLELDLLPYPSCQRCPDSIESWAPLLATPDPLYIQIWHVGWPMRCLAGAQRFRAGRMSAIELVDTFAMVPLDHTPYWLAVRPCLPVCPLWLGLLMNAIFYGAVLWLLWNGPSIARRTHRRRRGRCTKCGYNLHRRSAESSVCPECGEREAVG